MAAPLGPGVARRLYPAGGPPSHGRDGGHAGRPDGDGRAEPDACAAARDRRSDGDAVADSEPIAAGVAVPVSDGCTGACTDRRH